MPRSLVAPLPRGRRIILLHFGLVFFRFAHGRDRKPLMFMIAGFLDVSLSPKTNIILALGPQKTSNHPRKFQTISKHIFRKRKLSESEHVENVGKEGHRTIMKIRVKIT